jgi:hypothetical protein
MNLNDLPENPNLLLTPDLRICHLPGQMVNSILSATAIPTPPPATWCLVSMSLEVNMEEDDIIVPLMMDITDSEGTDDDRFSKHVEDTKRQCLRYPVRVLPFYALNPIRKLGAERLNAIIEEGAFIGVKLYPPLGYKIEEVVDICRMCDEADFPIIQHCSRKGFFKEPPFKEYCHPNTWRPYLMGGGQESFKRLKVCLAHFGGEEAHVNDASSGGGGGSENWAAAILSMMRGGGAGNPGCDRVFTDLSHHDDAEKAGYFDALRKLLTDQAAGSQILWGTDYFLLQRYCSDSNYTLVFKKELSHHGLWEKLTKPTRCASSDSTLMTPWVSHGEIF